MTNRDWKLKALTDIWTGDVDLKGERLIPTGLMGSLRWWFEVLVRGLGGKACDPTNKEVRCPDSEKDPTEPGHHCVVCELFGCTGWARKFRLIVLDADGNVIQKKIDKGTEFTLRFIPLRPIREEEWYLLDCTLRLIAGYGAIGGRTVLKPSDEAGRQNAFHHSDYGLINILDPDIWKSKKGIQDLKRYVAQTLWRREFDDGAFSWASLQNFWCVKGRYLARQDQDKSTFNRVIGRPEPKKQAQDGDSWLAGRRARENVEPESKKIFSFKHPKEGGRTFGFVKPGTVNENDIQTRLREVWGDNFSLLRSDQILQSVCGGAGGME